MNNLGLIGPHFFDGAHDSAACGSVLEVDGCFLAVLIDFEFDLDVLAGAAEIPFVFLSGCELKLSWGALGQCVMNNIHLLQNIICSPLLMYL